MIKKIDKALSKSDLISAFTEIGIERGMTIIVHVSMSKFGYIIGGARTFVDALIEAVGYNGTIVMPLQCGENSEPSYFVNPPMNFELYEKYRQNHPPFDSKLSETYHMSAIYDNLRRREKAVVSHHPNCAFVAFGKYARLITADQPLNFGLGEDSPLAKLYDLKAYCLLAGVDFDNMTALHLSEYRSDVRATILNGASISEDGQHVFKKYLDIELDSDDGFQAIGQILTDKGLVKEKRVNEAIMKFVRVDTAVDEGVEYFKNRG